MKPSAYNFSTYMPDGTGVFFNFYTLNLLALDRSESEITHKILKNPNGCHKKRDNGNLYNLIARKGFIIGDQIDELELLKEENYKGLIDRRNLSLTILPSLACNFRCVYCYQKENTKKMNPEVQDAVVRLVKKKLQRNGSLSVSWYGGEPLLQMDIINRLSKRFIALCKNRGAEYSASIITNGYLLNTKNTDNLKDLGVSEAQVTIDGPPELHDKRRVLKGGQNTFKRIIENVRKASEKINIAVRMNVDETNKDHIKDVIEILVKEGLEQRVGFYPGQTYPYTEVCKDIDQTCLSNRDYSLLGLRTLMILAENGFSYSYWIPSSRSNYCTADRVSSYVITPSGGIVNCWNETAKPDMEIGHLLKPKTERMERNAKTWRRNNSLEREECANCLLLPVCMGGCPYLFRLTGRSDCHKWKFHLKESLAYYYYYKTVERERKIMQHFQKASEAIINMKRLKDLQVLQT
jgi:uncharacterized protein